MAKPLIEVAAATFRYARHLPPAVRDVSFSVGAGDALGIVGESGSGKTTIGNALVGGLHPASGRVLVDGLPWSKIRRTSTQRRTVQMVFQDPYSSLNPMISPRQAVAEVFRVWDRLSPVRALAAAEEALAEVGLTGEVIARRPAALSGGQRQRVGIARALACQPQVLVADEPTSALDVSVQANILNLLRELRSSRGLALVLISHDLAVVDYLTDTAIVMLKGDVIESGPTHRLLTDASHPYTRRLVASIPGQAIGLG